MGIPPTPLVDGEVLVVLAGFLMSGEIVLADTLVSSVDFFVSGVFALTEFTVVGVCLVHQVFVVVVTGFLGFSGVELAVLVTSLEGRGAAFSEFAEVAVEVEVAALVVILVVEFFGLAGFVFVMGGFVSLDLVALLVSLLDGLFSSLFT